MTTATRYHGSPSCDDVPSIPRGVVGDQTTTHVFVDGHSTICLLDTGSQVTCVTDMFYHRFLRHRQLQPLSHIAVIGAADQVVPYKGYIEIRLMFPASTAGTQHEVNTLALVCPARQGNDDVPLLVGTNTSIVKEMLRMCKLKGVKQFINNLSVDCAWAKAYKYTSSSKCVQTYSTKATVAEKFPP